MRGVCDQHHAGKHLFIEKPPGETLGQALDLQAAAERNGVQCQVG